MEGCVMKKFKIHGILLSLLFTFLFSISVNASTNNDKYVHNGFLPNGDYICGMINDNIPKPNTIKGNLYIGGNEHSMIVRKGETLTVKGDIYLFGDLINYGTITVGGEIKCLNIYNKAPDLYTGTFDGEPAESYDLYYYDSDINKYYHTRYTYGNLAKVKGSKINGKVDLNDDYINVKNPYILGCDLRGHKIKGYSSNVPACGRFICEVCNTNLIDKNSSGYVPHTYGAKATCTTPQKCKKCGIVLKKALGHKLDKWTITKKATGTRKGTKVQKCTRCGKVVNTKTIPKTFVKLNVTSIPLQVNQKSTALKVKKITSGDKIKSFVSSNSKIVSVDKTTGKLTAKRVGEAKITVTSNTGAKATCIVTVQKGKVKTAKLTVPKQSISLKKGKSYKLSISRNPITANDKIIYQSSNKSVITVDSKGTVVAKKKGEASITVKSGNESAKILVVVK